MRSVLGSVLSIFIGILFLINLGGCAKKDAIHQLSEEEILRERVQAYWGHNIKETFDKSYEFEYPLYRKNVSLVEYLRNLNNNLQWVKVDISRVVIQDDTADVTLIMDTKVKGIPLLAGRKEAKDGFDLRGVEKAEKWIKVDGLWYHVPKKFRAQ